uniref:Bcl-2 Bcl-2 homology region 1-3 domain-containing protein n=1 Tax=Eptatretus burgeri TaxID=7764 RepID=A0A8C4Q5W8_EPTBU
MFNCDGYAYVVHRVAPDVLQNPFSQAEAILIQLCDEVFSKYREAYGEMVARLDPNCRGLSNPSSVAGTVTRVAEVLFSDGQVNWGRLVTLIVLLATVAQEIDDQFGTVDERAEVLSLEMSQFVMEHLGDWIRERGGWVSPRAGVACAELAGVITSETAELLSDAESSIFGCQD